MEQGCDSAGDGQTNINSRQRQCKVVDHVKASVLVSALRDHPLSHYRTIKAPATHLGRPDVALRAAGALVGRVGRHEGGGIWLLATKELKTRLGFVARASKRLQQLNTQPTVPEDKTSPTPSWQDLPSNHRPTAPAESHKKKGPRNLENPCNN